METPLSIVITTFNRRKLLERCLNSIQSQDYKDYEIIVIDDCSKPSYKEEILSDFPEIIYMYQEKNMGPGPARNKGIRKAKNNYVVIMDDDDIFKPNAFRQINSFLINNEYKYFPVYNFLCSNSQIKYDDYYRVYSFAELIDNTISGDLLHLISKQDFLDNHQYTYPDSRIGAESLLWYEIAINKGFPIINITNVIVSEDAVDRLTNINRQVKYSSEFAEYQINIIEKFKDEIIKTNNIEFLLKKYLGAVTYLLISGQKMKALKYWNEMLSYSKKYTLLFPLFFITRKNIIRLFFTYRKKRNA